MKEILDIIKASITKIFLSIRIIEMAILYARD